MACGSNTYPSWIAGGARTSQSAPPALRAFMAEGRLYAAHVTVSRVTTGRNGSDMRFRITRVASAVLALALITTTQTLPAAYAQNGDTNAHAAAFLLSQLVDNERIETTFGEMSFPDAGLTADVLFALYAANVTPQQTQPALAWFASQVDAYTGTASVDTYAGAVAKTLLVSAAADNTTLFDVPALRQRLLDRQQASGRFTDASAFGDFSNTITQSLAVLALIRTADEQLTGEPAAFLAAQACADGGFPSGFDQESCTSNVDATGFAVQALHAAGNATAVQAAVSWLLQELAAGRIVNANAAGLAASSFALTGQTEAFSQTQAIITGLQAGCVANVPQAIRFTDSDAGDRTRATAQALFGRLGGNLLTVSVPTVGVPPVALDCPPRFSDLDYDVSVHAANIVALQQAGSLSGFSDGTFRPRATVTRGQFATLLVTATNTPFDDTGTPFSDLSGDTHARALATLYARDVITGFADGTVRSSTPITRAQAAAIVSRFLASEGTATVAEFTDITDSPLRDAIQDVTERGIFSGRDGRFNPSGPLRRDQAASVITQVVTLS